MPNTWLGYGPGPRKPSRQRGVRTRVLNLIQIIMPARRFPRGVKIFRTAKAIRGFNFGKERSASWDSHNRSEIVMRSTGQKGFMRGNY